MDVIILNHSSNIAHVLLSMLNNEITLLYERVDFGLSVIYIFCSNKNVGLNAVNTFNVT